MRWLLFAAAAVVLSGCAIPPIISVVSLVIDVASYGATGKTVTDHGLSAVLQKDCALLRGLDGPVCVPEGSAEASVKPPRDAETRASRRLARLEEESNRATAHQWTRPDARVTLLSTFATDPSMAPRSIPAPAREAADRARDHRLDDDRLDEAVYLRDEASPAPAMRARRQVSGAGYLSPGYLSQGIVPERETDG